MLRAFESRALREISAPKRGEAAGSYRKLHDEKLHNFYS
jgi:hypothetical protein